AAMAAVPASARQYGNGPGEQSDLHLTLEISQRGFTLASAGSVLYQDGVAGRVPTLPKVNGDYDYSGLTRLVREIKGHHPKEHVIYVGAVAGLPYEQFIAALDAVRGTESEPLFPDPQLYGGLE